ncbi:MAG: hypothetical protein ACPGXK_04460 [Phycisphaerae bacterium]
MRSRLVVISACVCLASISLEAAVIDIVPVDSDCGGQIVGNEIIVEPGCSIALEVRVYGFAPDVVAAFQNTVDCASLEADVSGKLIVSDFDVIVAGCMFSNNFCTGINEDNPRYLLANAASTLPACQLVTACPGGDPGEYACGSVAIFGDSGPDDGMAYYASTYRIDVPEDFGGTAAFTVQSDPNNTFLKNPMADDIQIDAIHPAWVTVVLGQCCGPFQNPFCMEGLNEAQCDDLGGFYTEGGACSGSDIDNNGIDDSCCCCCATDSDCNDGNACTADACVSFPACTCDSYDTTPAGQCCNPADGSLRLIDDGDPCTDDFCNPDGSVSHVVSPSTSCDDGNGCTFDDRCDLDGACVGIDINLIACNTIDECPNGTQDCRDGFCVCALETKLELVVADSDKPDPNCFDNGDAVAVDVLMGAGSECVNGGQFLINYDPTCLAFHGLSPSADFPLLLFTEIDENAGTVFAAVGIMPGGDCTQGPDVLASLSFTKLGECGTCNVRFDSVNPQNTILSNSDGNAVALAFNDSKFIRLSGDVHIIAPEGATEVNPDCDAATAVVAWANITATDNCDDESTPPVIDCTAAHDGGIDIDQLIANGGIFPQGISTFTCTATNSCGDAATREWQVVVTDQHALDVEVQLSPTVVGDPISRCIDFAFYSDCVQSPNLFSADLNFGFPLNFPGKWSGELKVPKGQYACITAKDRLHSLRSVSDVDCVDDTLVAQFKGDPIFDGNWLVQGNLDCWKANGNGDTIDILDFGMFVSQYLEDLDPNTPCGAEGPHSDINGDGVVDGADFAFISQNFLATSKNSCCEDGAAAQPNPAVVSISVKDLRRRGLGEFAVADLNADGVVDPHDMTAFQVGRRPLRTGFGPRPNRGKPR